MALNEWLSFRSPDAEEELENFGGSEEGANVRHMLNSAVGSFLFLEGPQLLWPRQAPHGDPPTQHLSVFSFFFSCAQKAKTKSFNFLRSAWKFNIFESWFFTFSTISGI